MLMVPAAVIRTLPVEIGVGAVDLSGKTFLLGSDSAPSTLRRAGGGARGADAVLQPCRAKAGFRAPRSDRLARLRVAPRRAAESDAEGAEAAGRSSLPRASASDMSPGDVFHELPHRAPSGPDLPAIASTRSAFFILIPPKGLRRMI
jgi:hypothetical protein